MQKQNKTFSLLYPSDSICTMLMSSFLAEGIKIADLMSSLGIGLDGVYRGYEPESVTSRLGQMCDALILTCGLACCHPRDLPPPSQEPVDRSAGLYFYIEGVVMIHIQVFVKI